MIGWSVIIRWDGIVAADVPTIAFRNYDTLNDALVGLMAMMDDPDNRFGPPRQIQLMPACERDGELRRLALEIGLLRGGDDG